MGVERSDGEAGAKPAESVPREWKPIVMQRFHRNVRIYDLK